MVEEGRLDAAEAGPQPADFEQLKLDVKSLPLKSERTDQAGFTFKVHEGESDILLEDGAAKLSLRAVRKFAASGALVSEGFRAAISRDGGEVEAKFTISYPATESPSQEQELRATATGSTLKSDSEKRLPPQLGLRLYAKVLRIPVDIADERDMPIVHKVSRTLGMSDTPMTPEKWNEIFEPFLSRQGYQKVEDGEWTKTYAPRRPPHASRPPGQG